MAAVTAAKRLMGTDLGCMDAGAAIWLIRNPQAARIAKIAVQAGTYHTKSTKAWAVPAAKAPAMAPAQIFIRSDPFHPATHQEHHMPMQASVRPSPILPVSSRTCRYEFSA